MPVFNDAPAMQPLVDPGDYIFCVTGLEVGISTGGITNGAEKFELTLELEPSGKVVTERLIDHPKTGWKIDNFIKAAGIKLVKGQAFDFRRDEAASLGCSWVNPIGLRGWCNIGVEEYVRKDGTPGKVNKVVAFHCDKPKLPRRVIEAAEDDVPFN